MNKNYNIVRLTRDDDALISQLINTASVIHNRKKDTIDWLKWKYFGSPFGEAICLIATNQKGDIAGEVTFGIYEVILNKKNIKCLISFQTMVHPNHQKKGIFSMLTKEAMRIAQNENISLVFNFPNQASFSPFLKLGYYPINHIKNWVSFQNKAKILLTPLSIKKPFIANSVTEINKKALHTLDELKHFISPLNIENKIIPNRTFDFLIWRYFTYPLYEYHIVDIDSTFAIIRCGKRGKLKEVQLMELFQKEKLLNKTELKKLTKKIKEVFNPDIILCNLSENHPVSLLMKQIKFYSLPHSINFFSFALNKDYEKLMKKENWIITATEFHRY